jgi:hypothetical protein
MHKFPMIRIGDQVYAKEDGEEFGAVRAVTPNGQPEIVVYVENKGDFTIPLTAVTAVHDGKVIVNVKHLAAEIRAAIPHAHESERE